MRRRKGFSLPLEDGQGKDKKGRRLSEPNEPSTEPVPTQTLYKRDEHGPLSKQKKVPKDITSAMSLHRALGSVTQQNTPTLADLEKWKEEKKKKEAAEDSSDSSEVPTVILEDPFCRVIPKKKKIILGKGESEESVNLEPPPVKSANNTPSWGTKVPPAKFTDTPSSKPSPLMKEVDLLYSRKEMKKAKKTPPASTSRTPDKSADLVFTNERFNIQKQFPLRREGGELDMIPIEHKLLLRVAAERAMRKEAERKERESFVMWRRPLDTTLFACSEAYEILKTLPTQLAEHAVVITVLFSLYISFITLDYLDLKDKTIQWLLKDIKWYFSWIVLGFLSSVGLGSGLPTFILYLAPHIASVTVGAYACGGTNFPEPPYPNEIQCPWLVRKGWEASLWNIMCKIYFDAMCWGIGSALGELPPYFMARSARLSEVKPTAEEDEFNEIQKRIEEHIYHHTYMDTLKELIERAVKNVGFLAILVCASVPNPLFDLAGITCGHYMVPFWTFFGATLLGKGFIKITFQVIFIIVALNENLVSKALSYFAYIPLFGNKLQKPIADFFADQKKKIRSGGNVTETHLLAVIFDVLSGLIIVFFVISIINWLAQRWVMREQINFNKILKSPQKKVKSN